MSALAPVFAADCRAMALECGRRANKFFAQGMTSSAMREIERARELVLLGLKFEIAEQRLPSGAAACAADSPAGSTSSPIPSGTNHESEAPRSDSTTLAAREADESAAPQPQSDSDAISEVKGMARPENAAGVEPPLSVSLSPAIGAPIIPTSHRDIEWIVDHADEIRADGGADITMTHTNISGHEHV